MSISEHDANGAPEIAEKVADNGEEKQQQKTTTSPAVENPNSTRDEDENATKRTERPVWRRVYDIAFWTPPNCRWDQDKPPKFSMPLNILFAFAGAFTVANLYYNHPILNILARDFGVPYEKVAQIPTVAQAGYAGGLFFLCPLGDLLKRRPFVLSLVFFTASMRYIEFQAVPMGVVELTVS